MVYLVFIILTKPKDVACTRSRRWMSLGTEIFLQMKKRVLNFKMPGRLSVWSRLEKEKRKLNQ